MGKNKPKILIVSGGMGHISMAEAAASAYKKGKFLPKIFKVLNEKNSSLNPFRFIYAYFPFILSLPYELGKNPAAQKLFNLASREIHLKKIKKIISSFQPDAVVSTAYYLDPILKKIKKEQPQLPYFYLSHEPWADHPLLYPSTPDLTFVYDQKAKRIAQKWGVKKESIVPLGWLIRPQFYSPLSLEEKERILDKLNFKKDILTVLIIAGSGTNAVLKILPALFRSPTPLQVIFVSGRSRSTYHLAKSIAKVINTSFANWESKIKMRVFGFSHQVDKYMKISSLVVGKAGPQLIFESVATQKPFFAISHLPGHQDSLLPLIKKKKLGWTEERVDRAINLFLKLVKKQKRIQKYRRHIIKERSKNITAADILVKVTKDYLKKKNLVSQR